MSVAISGTIIKDEVISYGLLAPVVNGVDTGDLYIQTDTGLFGGIPSVSWVWDKPNNIWKKVSSAAGNPEVLSGATSPTIGTAVPTGAKLFYHDTLKRITRIEIAGLWQDVGSTDVIIEASNPNPNTIGTVFTPNTIQNVDVIYIASDDTAWIWDVTTLTYVPLVPAGRDFWRSGALGTLLPDGALDPTEFISRTGNVGIGFAGTPASKLDVNGAEVLRPVALANIAANGAIGAAAATVDIASVLLLPQTTANITLTLPAPTNTQAGRLLSVINTGTAQVKIQESFIDPTKACTWIYNGGWRLVGNELGSTTLTASRVATIADNYKTLLSAVPVTITVNTNTFMHGIFRCRQTTNAGIITVAAGAGMTLIAPFGASTLGLNGAYTIVEVIGTNIYVA